MHGFVSTWKFQLGVLLLAAIGPAPEALSAGGFPPGPRPTLFGDTIYLEGDQTHEIEALIIERPTTIVLNGFDLELEISRAFEAKFPLVIRGFGKDEPVPKAPLAPPPAPVGASYDPGPRTPGNGAGEGRHGGVGGTGVQGSEGLPGKPAGRFVLRLGGNANATGVLVIDASGGPGGKGGTGANGGPGGNGEQGRKGRRDAVGFCSAGGARGGNAGEGGRGGRGGTGGKGGKGGVVVLQAGSSTQRQWLGTVQVDIEGGAGGPAGDGGEGGSPGKPGHGGMENGSPPFGCENEENTRMGQPKDPGSPGDPGEPGPAGDEATLIILD